MPVCRQHPPREQAARVAQGVEHGAAGRIEAMKLLPCLPFAGRLSEAACSERYRKAQGYHRLADSACRTCDTGRDRAGLSGPHATFAGRKQGTRYRVVEGRGAFVLVECSCGKRRLLSLSSWQTRPPLGCSQCKHRTLSSGEWANDYPRGGPPSTLSQVSEIDAAKRLVRQVGAR